MNYDDKFEMIENPYAPYAVGNVVGDPNMFFGRRELIQRIAHTIQESRSESKCVLIYGQYRIGKSSILYHLGRLFQKDQSLLTVDVGDFSVAVDIDSTVPVEHQILMCILWELKWTIKNRIEEENFSQLDISIPSYQEFYAHPTPLQLFEKTFEELKSLTTQGKDWRGIRVVLLIDEFQYIYDLIVAGKSPETFMQNWKALLQANYFSAVLVGQDLIQKLKLRFPNEFGTTQDERVTYLKEEDARKLIDEPIRIGGKEGDSRYREQAIERILDLTAGSPFYIQIICNRLVNYMNVKHTGLITEADVKHVKNELISGGNALHYSFHHLFWSGDPSPDAISQEDVLKVLTIIANNSSRKELCPHDRINCKTDTSIDAILNDLVVRDIVKRYDKSYQIKVGLFREWLVANG